MGNEMSAAACLQIAMGDVTSYVPDDRRKLTYNLIVAVFVISVFSCIMANAGACFKLWKNRHRLIERGYFGLVFQANISYLMVGVTYFFATVPLAVFLTKEQAEKYSNTAVYFVNVVIYQLAVHSLPFTHFFSAVYIYGTIADPAKLEKIKKMLCWVTGAIWTTSAIIALSVSLLSCSYTYNVYSQVYDYKCNNIYNKYNTRLLQWAVEYSMIILNVLTLTIVSVAVWKFSSNKVQVLASSVENMLSLAYTLLIAFQASYVASNVSYALPSSDLWVFPQKRVFDTVELVCFTVSGIFVIWKSNKVLEDPIEMLDTGSERPVIVVQSRPSSVSSTNSYKNRPCTVG